MTRFLLLLSFFIAPFSYGQSLIVGIPSADVAEKNHLEITHETQLNFWQQPQKWNSFNFACYGLSKSFEITSTLNNVDNEGSANMAIGLGAKKVFNLDAHSDKHERKFIIGSNVLYSTQTKDFGIWTYGLLSMRLPATKTRLTGGLSYGNSQTFGFASKLNNGIMTAVPNNKVTFLGGLEQPLTNKLSFVCDWYSGSHDLAAFIPAMQFDFGHNVFIMGYKFPNNPSSGNQAMIVELMISIPTKKRSASR